MRFVQHAAAALLALAIVPYLATPIYRFRASAPFRGPAWYNPYAAWTGPGLRTNLHAHSRAWGGVTHGGDTPEAVREAYAARGYAVAAISNYHTIEPTGGGPITVPTYEHGINGRKSHRLAIGATRVDWFDVPLLQGVHHKQYLLDRLRLGTELVAIVHPALRGGHSHEDLQRLSGYELLEVLNHFGIAESHWDAALSAGHPVWALGNDDTHDVADAGQTGVMWTAVDARTPDRGGVIAALRAGRHVAVSAPGGTAQVALEWLKVEHDTLQVRFSQPVTSIVAVIDGGARLDSVASARGARFAIPATAGYVRIVASTPATTLYLNPIIRGDGTLPVVAASSVDLPATVAQRAIALGVLGWLAAGTGPRRRLGRAGGPLRPRRPRLAGLLRLRLVGRIRMRFGRRRAGLAGPALPPG